MQLNSDGLHSTSCTVCMSILGYLVELGNAALTVNAVCVCVCVCGKEARQEVEGQLWVWF